MKKLIVYIFLLSFCFTSAQETTKEYPKHSLGVNFQGNYSYRYLKVNRKLFSCGTGNPWENYEALIQSRNKTEQGGFGFTTGINYVLKLHKNVGIEIAAQFAGRKNIFKDVFILDGNFHEIGKGTINDTYLYVDFPVKVNYYFLNKEKFHLFVSSGLNTSIYLTTKSIIKSEYYDGTNAKVKRTDRNKMPDKVLLSYIGSLGFDYDISSKFTLRIEPIVNVAFYTNRDTPILQYPYSFGLNTGVYYNF
ncbi:MAG: hypothetical protein KDE33_10720 [Bacteroidetes bacterium]|nr:hypothetical protein [Bacteroidota bacterium]MCB9226376.1 hypothetical protein [Chitinophagales bacterium]